MKLVIPIVPVALLLALGSPAFAGEGTKAQLQITVDNVLEEVWLNGRSIEVDPATAGDWMKVSIIELELRQGKNVLAVKCTDHGVIAGLLADIRVRDVRLISSGAWKYSPVPVPDWQSEGFDDSPWPAAIEYAVHPLEGVWGTRVQGAELPLDGAIWIWSGTNDLDGAIDSPVYLRFSFDISSTD